MSEDYLDYDVIDAVKNFDDLSKFLNHTLDARDDGWGLIHRAAEVGNIEAIDYLLINVKNIQITDKNGRKGKNILHIAADNDKANVIKKYACVPGSQDTGECLDINERDDDDKSPIYYAVVKHHYEVAKLLIDRGAKITDTLLQSYKSKEGSKDNIKKLLANNLILCAVEGRTECIEEADKKSKIKEYISTDKATVDYQNIDGLTALHIAATKGDLDIIKFLIAEEDADINIQDKSKKTALHTAAENGYINIVKYFINDKGMSINDYPLLLHYAIKSNNINIVKFLIDKDPSINIDAEDRNGNRAIHIAAKENHFEIAKLLVEEKADLDVKNSDEKTPLDLAENHSEIKELLLIKLLINSIENNDQEKFDEYITNSTNLSYRYGKDKWTPLHYASAESYGLTFAKKLIGDNTTNIEVEDRNGNRPIHIAAKEGNFEIAKLLVEKEADLDVKNSADETPLILAESHPEIKKLLVIKLLINSIENNDQEKFDEYIAKDPDLSRAYGDNKLTPLHYAVKSGSNEFTRTLIKKGASIDAEDRNGNRPLHIAAKEDSIEIARLLIDKGADIAPQNRNGSTPLRLSSHDVADLIISRILFDTIENGDTPKFNGYYKSGIEGRSLKTDYKDQDGRTLLHLASWHRNNEIVSILIKKGTDVNAVDNSDQISLHLAVARDSNHDVAKALIDNDADVNRKDLHGQSPLHIAAKYGHEEGVRLLLENRTDNDSKDRYGKTPLDLAEEGNTEGHAEVQKLLLIKGLFNAIENDDVLKASWYIEKEPEIVNYKGINGNDFPITCATQNNGYEIIKLLIEKNANLSVANSDGNKATHIAAKNGKENILRVLFLTGELDVDEKGQNDWTPLHFATSENHLNIIKFLLEEKGANIHIRTQDGSNALHIAAENGNEKIVNFLLDVGLNVNSLDLSNNTPLHQAVKHNKTAVVELLINSGAKVDLENDNGYTASQLATRKEIKESLLGKEIFDAIWQNDKNKIESILLGDQSDHYLNEWGWTPLHYATSLRDDLSIIRFLIEEKNANVESKTQDGDKPLHIASRYGHLEVIRYLFAKGININETGKDNWTALHYAVNNHHPGVTDFLIKNGADIAAVNSFSETPLQVAGSERISNLLLNRSLLRAVNRDEIEKAKRQIHLGADVNYLDSFSNNEPLLHNASKRGSLEMVKTLVQNGVNINALDSNGNQSIHVAAQYGRANVVEFLLEKLDVNRRNNNDWTPLHYACAKGGLIVARVLIRSGADVTIQDSNSDKPIHIAAKNGHKDIIELLFAERSDQLSINERGYKNKTTLHYASEGGYLEIVKLLVLNDANIDALDLDNKIALDLAINPEIKKFLLEKALSNAIEQNDLGKVQEYLGKINTIVGQSFGAAIDNGWAHLHDAASKGSLEVARYLLRAGKSVDAVSYGMKPIHCASKYGHKDVLELFLNVSSKKNIDYPDQQHQWTPLHYAVRYGNKAVVELLVNEGANTNLSDFRGDTPLHIATKYGHRGIVEFLLNNGRIDINETGANGKTALHYAAKKNRLAIAELLIERDADISIEDLNQKTPLNLAKLKNNAEITALLQREELFSAIRNEDCSGTVNFINCSKIEDAISNGADIDMKNKWGRTALHIAALAGKLEAARFLIEEKNVNVRIRDYNGNNPLHAAVSAGELSIVELLLKKGSLSINIQNYDGENPLHIAAKYGYKDIADFLIKAGLNVNSLSRKNWTPLHYGANAGHVDTVKVLVKSGAKITIKNSDNKSPLEIAKKREIIDLLRNEELVYFVVSNNVQKVKDYIKDGANIDYQSVRSPKCSLLCYAAQKDDRLRIVKFLIYNGADIYLEDSNGNNPLHVAAKNGSRDIAEFLLSNGAEVNKAGWNNFTPLHHAVASTGSTQKLDLVKLLINNGAGITYRDFQGSTPLELAISKQKSANFANRRNYVSIIQALLDSSLFEAIQHRDLRSIRSYFDIGTGANIDAVNRNDFTPLHEATLIGDLRITEFLLSKYPNVYYRDHQYGFLPLHTAIKGGNLEVAKPLISKYPGINYKAREDVTPLHIGAQYASVEILELLLNFNKGYKGLSVNDVDSKSWTALHYAAKGGNLEVIKFLTEKGVNIDAIDSNNLKALHIAALYGHESAVKFFTEAKHLSLDDKDKNNKTLMHYAAQGGNLDIINFLVNKGLGADVLDIDGINPLHIACEYGRVNAVELFLEYGLNINDADLNNKTPLHYATKSGNLEVVKLLNSNGANINSHDVKPLHIAAQYGYRDIVEFFIIHKQQSVSNRGGNNWTPLHYAASGSADSEFVKENKLIKAMEFLLYHDADINVQDEYGASPLHIASQYGNKAIVDFLIQRRANIDRTDIHKSTPLHYTSREGNLGIAKLLVEEGANTHRVDDQGQNPAHSAAKNGHKNVALFLIRNGVYANTVDTSNAWTLLHYASDFGDLDFVQQLLLEGANIYKTNFHNEKPIHIAAAKGYKEIVGCFIDSGLSVDDFGNHNRTPLHYAVRGNHLESVRYLAERSANIFSTDSAGDKALHIATKHGYQEIIRFFIDKGLSINDLGHNGWTPLHYAAERGRVRIVRFLIEEMGADINRLTVNYEKPLDLAQDKNNHRVVRYLQRVARHDRDRVHIRTKRSSFAADQLQPDVSSKSVKPSFFMVDFMVSAKNLLNGFFSKRNHNCNTERLNNFSDTVLPSITPDNFFNCENMSLMLCVADAMDGNRRKHERLQQVTPYTVRPAFTAKKALETFKISIKQKLQDYNRQDRAKIYSDLLPILPKIREDLQKSVELEGRRGLDACMRLHLKQFSSILDSHEKHSSKVPTLVSCVDIDCKNLSCAFY